MSVNPFHIVKDRRSEGHFPVGHFPIGHFPIGHWPSLPDTSWISVSGEHICIWLVRIMTERSNWVRSSDIEDTLWHLVTNGMIAWSKLLCASEVSWSSPPESEDSAFWSNV